MKKIILCSIIIFFINTLNSYAATTTFKVNGMTELSSITKDSTLNFKFISTGGDENNNININFPNGFEYLSGSLSAGCNTQLFSGNNLYFNYSYSGANLCKADFSYKITTTGTGIKISSLFNLTDGGNVVVNTVPEGKISLEKAETVDSDDNGFIDKINLFFSDDVSNFNSIGLSIGGKTATLDSSSSGNNILLNLADTLFFKTGDKPLITHSGNIFNNVDPFTNFQTTDKSIPILLKINNTYLNSDIISSSNTLNFLFSEDLFPTNTGAYKLQTSSGTDIDGTFNISNNSLIFTANSTIISGNYKIISDGTSKDWNNNFFTLNNTFNLISTIDIESPIGIKTGNGTGILINNGAASTNNNYVQLSLNAYDNVGVTKMMVSNSSNFNGSNYENYSDTKNNYMLSSGTGTKTIYIKFKDGAGNESSVYSDEIDYVLENSYLNFNNIDSTYTNNSTITLSGGCNNTDSLITSINYSIGLTSGNFNCNNSLKKWTNTFNITPNIDNIIKIWYGSDYESSTIKNSLTITNPVQKTIIHKENYNSREYSFDSFILKYNTNQTKTSQNKLITNGYYNLQVLFTLNSDGENYTVTNLIETLTCNSGYSKNGNTCVKNSSGGGGGGGGGYYIPTCADNQLECKPYLNGYVWLKKSGINCQGGNIGKTCIYSNDQIINTNSGITLTGTTNSGVTTTINLDIYISKSKDNFGNLIYKTTNLKIKAALDKAEIIIIKKISKLLNSNTISNEQYKNALDNYNNFVLYLTKYKLNKEKSDYNKAKDYLLELAKIYNLKVKITKPVIIIKHVSDYYSLTKDLKLGDYNTEVNNLQNILKTFGYYNYGITGYFGNETKKSLERFTKEYLKITFNGYLDNTLREAILNLETK